MHGCQCVPWPHSLFGLGVGRVLIMLVETQLVQCVEHFGTKVAAVLEVSVLVVGVDVL